jgi:hypothetical protein
MLRGGARRGHAALLLALTALGTLLMVRRT